MGPSTTAEEAEAVEAHNTEGIERSAPKPAPGPEPACFLCRAVDDAVPLLSVRYQGQGAWVCVRCLPRLIHG